MDTKKKKKVEEAIQVLIELGMPKEQQNDRSALCLLALLNLPENVAWSNSGRPMLGVTPIMEWIKKYYETTYAPNTREIFRRQTLHQFMEGSIVEYNPDDPGRPVNSPKACYRITEETHNLLTQYGSASWRKSAKQWKGNKRTLSQKYAQERNLNKVPVSFQGRQVLLSPGVHSKLIETVVSEFGSRFAPGAIVVYLGDTGAKQELLDQKTLLSLGMKVAKKGKLPDVVLYLEDKNWLFLIEAVTSHGPIDEKRLQELKNLFGDCLANLVFVSAFSDKQTMAKYMPQLAWETEVWISEAPSHMIHFNGEKFLASYSSGGQS